MKRRYIYMVSMLFVIVMVQNMSLSAVEKSYSIWERVRLYAKRLFNSYDEEWLRYKYEYPYETRLEFLLTLTPDEQAFLDTALLRQIRSLREEDKAPAGVEDVDSLITQEMNLLAKQHYAGELEAYLQSSVYPESFYILYEQIMAYRAQKAQEGAVPSAL